MVQNLVSCVNTYKLLIEYKIRDKYVDWKFLINSLPNNKILDRTRMKAFAEHKINVIQKLKFALRRVESIVGKRENAGYQHFLVFPRCFRKGTV